MLWYKGWLETRIRLLMAFGFLCLVLVPFSPIGFRAEAGLAGVLDGGWLLVAIASLSLAGGGVVTQPSFQATRGLHESTLFTLSLPVSRFRLIAVRAGLGWLEMAGVIGVMCCGMWILFPSLRGTTTPEEMCKHALALTACSAGLYAIPMLLSTFLDDYWRMLASTLGFAALWWLSNDTVLPVSTNIFRAMGDRSLLVTHTMPWPAMAFSLGLAAILFFAALKIAQSREY